jgi:hypothetical protein
MGLNDEEKKAREDRPRRNIGVRMTSRGLEPVQETEEAASAREDGERKTRDKEAARKAKEAAWAEEDRRLNAEATRPRRPDLPKPTPSNPNLPYSGPPPPARQPGKMTGGRIAVIIGLSVLAGVLVLAYFGAKSQTISSPVGCLPRSACTRANVELFLAGAAAVGAVIVYWSRPRR